MVPRTRSRFVALVAVAMSGCAGPASPSSPRTGQQDDGAPVEIVATQTVTGLGAGQGVAVRGEFVYLYGDADTGVIRELRFEPEPAPRLVPTGRDVRLTRAGEDVVPHPTGLTFHPEHGAILGNTVSGQGTIYFVDFERMLEEGTLDEAVSHRVLDDVAVDGTRPELVRWNDDRFVATSDYGGRGNELRLYDPDRLREAARTSDAGVVAARFPSGGFVQTLHWIDAAGVLVFAQNRAAGTGYRLTFVDLARGQRPAQAAPRDVPDEERELEGFALVEDGWVILLNAHPEDNVQIARLRRRLPASQAP